MQSQMERLQTSRTADILACIQAKVERLQAVMQAEKERELANIEQHYSHFKKTHHLTNYGWLCTTIYIPSPRKVTRSATKNINKTTNESVNPTAPSTSSLDVIKRIRKTCGVLRWMHLIGINLDDVNERSQNPSVPAGERFASSGKEYEQGSPVPALAMVEAVTRAVEAALQNIFSNRSTFPTAKHNPHHRKHKDEEVQLEKATEPSHHRDFILGRVQHLFKQKLSILQDIDFITHEPATVEDVHAYEYEDGPGPNWNSLAFDLAHNHSSLWNVHILELLQELQERSKEKNWAVKKTDNYISELLKERYKWTQAGKESSKATHHQMTVVLDHIVALKSKVPEDTLPSWKWLQSLIKTLGEHGMSSKESKVENGVESIPHVKNIKWQRNIDWELEIVDLQHGSRPLTRRHGPNNPTSSRAVVKGLPQTMYDGAWIAQLTECQTELLEVSHETFWWMKVVVA
ncbi:hypothetical protein BS17DRAFT_769621 [Gyrodon lividus]|nr:hypothetical protein BS17DRAFT_769621 [Gyrodon lividus]